MCDLIITIESGPNGSCKYFKALSTIGASFIKVAISTSILSILSITLDWKLI